MGNFEVAPGAVDSIITEMDRVDEYLNTRV